MKQGLTTQPWIWNLLCSPSWLRTQEIHLLLPLECGFEGVTLGPKIPFLGGSTQGLLP